MFFHFRRAGFGYFIQSRQNVGLVIDLTLFIFDFNMEFSKGNLHLINLPLGSSIDNNQRSSACSAKTMHVSYINYGRSVLSAHKVSRHSSSDAE